MKNIHEVGMNIYSLKTKQITVKFVHQTNMPSFSSLKYH